MAKSKLPKELTTVTPLSKFFAGALFVFLPIVAFLMGMNYQKNIDAEIAYKMQEANSSASLVVPTQAMMKMEIPEDWKTYMNKKYSFELMHPAEITPKETTTDKVTRVIIKKDYLTFEISPKENDKASTDSSKIAPETDEPIKWMIDSTPFGYIYSGTKGNNQYSFTITSEQGEKANEAKQIISTFKFTDSK